MKLIAKKDMVWLVSQSLVFSAWHFPNLIPIGSYPLFYWVLFLVPLLLIHHSIIPNHHSTGSS